MNKSFFIDFLLLYFVTVSQQLNICDDIVNGNAQKYSLSEINACASALTGVLHSERNVDCPEFNCTGTECLFGYATDGDGCLTCDCVPDGEEELFEADIVLTNETKRFLRKNIQLNAPIRKRRGAARSIPLWNRIKSGNNYIVPYSIAGSIGPSGRRAIAGAVADFAKHTCIRLVPRDSHREYLNFYNGGGCSSPVGRSQRQQGVSLGVGCWYKGTVIHEILHSLGFWHEQSRPDRDNYVRINYNNIPRNLAYNFNKLSRAQIDSRGSAYDIGSVMHYSSGAFSSNGRPSITDLRGNRIRTQRNGFSQSDIQQLNAMYGCKKTGTGTTTTTTTTATGTGTTTTGTGTGTGTGTTCTDKNGSCRYWASIGECQKNPLYMLPNCCRSCRARPSSCTDKDSYCSSWARSGYCYNYYAAYMRANCKRSCNLCSSRG